MGEKCQNLPFMGRTRTLVSVQKVGTDTKNGYRYPLDKGKVVSVPIKWYWYPFTRKGLVPVPINVVSVPMLPVALIFVTLALLSPKFVHR